MAMAASIICWVFALGFLLLAFRAIHKDKYGLAGTALLCCAFAGLAGQPWFQGLAKTWVISNVNEKLEKLGNQIDSVHSTTSTMQTQLQDHQTKIDKHQRELEGQQCKLRNAQGEIEQQQGNITNQFDQIADLQSELSSFQTNINNQQRKLEDVSYWVENLYANSTHETFGLSDTNDVAVFTHTNGIMHVAIRLKHFPIPGSLEVTVAEKDFLPIPQRAKVEPPIYKNVVCVSLRDYRSPEFIVHYVKDSRHTNVVQIVKNYKEGAITLDGRLASVTTIADGFEFRFTEDLPPSLDTQHP